MDIVMILLTLFHVTLMVVIVVENQSELNIVIFVIVIIRLITHTPHRGVWDGVTGNRLKFQKNTAKKTIL